MKVKQKYRIVVLFLIFMVTTSLTSGAERGQSTTDSEQIIDVEKLRASLNEATSPISKRIKESNLIEKFENVTELLQEKDIDKDMLLQALESLRDEMYAFTRNWSELTEPLWKGQDAIGQTIDKVRTMLASSNTGQPSKKVKALLQNYEKRLSSLDVAIKNEKNEERKKRLKLVFANVLSLRKLTERAGTIDLGPAQQAVYVKIIESLSNLEVALTNSTFQVERTRIILAGQAEFVGNYVDILKGLIESEKLASVLGDMNTAGNGIGALAGDLGGLNGKIKDFTSHMNALAERLSINIDSQASPMVHVADFDEQDIDEMIEQYSSNQSKSTKVVKAK
jgi:hypothetical protein